MRAICIANGTSLTKEDVEYCKGRGKIYAVKESVNLCPWADVLYSADTDWWEHYNGYDYFAGERWTVSHEASKKWGINHIDYDSSLVWGTANILATGGNSGFQALNLAVMQGATEVILLGYDMGHPPDRKHWWTGKITRPIRCSNYADWITKFDKASKVIPVPVLNATRNSALNCFPKVNLRDVC
jgi:hypothetical protein